MKLQTSRYINLRSKTMGNANIIREVQKKSRHPDPTPYKKK
jgi:hypothetical protein